MEVRRVCKQCGIEKDIDQFHKSKVNKGGHKPICAECFNSNVQDPVDKFIIATRWQLLAMGIKHCPSCGNYLNYSDFNEDKNRKDGLRCYCYECERTKGLEYDRRPDIKDRRHQKESTPEFLENLSIYRANSPVFHATRQAYMQTSKYKESQKEYNKRLHRRLRGKVSIKIYSALKLQDIKKSLEFNEYLGCTIEYFKEYIASLFQEGMTWDNWGRGSGMWHLDHIRPCASFNLNNEDEQKICFNYKNQQPLWESDNFKKSSKFEGVFYHHKK